MIHWHSNVDAARQPTDPVLLVDLPALAPTLQQAADGIWYPPQSSSLDYPDDGNAFCFQVEDHSFWFRYRNRMLVEMVRRFPPPGAIFDIGGGNGFVTRGLREAGFAAVVVEPGPAGAANAAARGLAPVVCATLEDAQFLPESLPAVGLFDVLEHLPDDRAVLDTLAHLMPLGGRLYLTVPAFSWLWSDDDDLAGHHRRYTRRSLRRVVEAAGFTVDTDTYLFAPLPLPILALRVVPTKLGLRRPADPATLKQELKPDAGVVTFAITRLLDVERWWLTHVGAVPFGSSCLLVATRR